MRIRNLNPKPTTFTGNPLMRTRWNTIYRNGDGCFTVNSGNNKRNGLDADFIRTTTSFDIIANYDTGIPGADVVPWITGLPDGQVCFLCDVEPLRDINVMMQAYGQTDKNKNFNVFSGIVKASGVPGSRIVVSAACRHQLDNRNCATVRFASDAEPDTDCGAGMGRRNRHRKGEGDHGPVECRRVHRPDRALRGGSGRGGGIPPSPHRLDWGLAA